MYEIIVNPQLIIFYNLSTIKPQTDIDKMSVGGKQRRNVLRLYAIWV